MQRRLLLTALLTSAALAAPIAAKVPPQKDWSASITLTAEGYHLRGNPDAPIKLVEYVSYTCPHCGIFEMQGGEELTQRFVRSGTVSYEVRPFFLNEIDKAISLIAYCGPPAKFFINHSQLLRYQHDWLRNPTAAQLQRWSSPDWTIRTRAIAEDLNLYGVMGKLGFARSAIDGCLADSALLDRLQQGSEDAYYNRGVKGTPAFFYNGELLPETTWPELRERLNQAMNGFV